MNYRLGVKPGLVSQCQKYIGKGRGLTVTTTKALQMISQDSKQCNYKDNIYVDSTNLSIGRCD